MLTAAQLRQRAMDARRYSENPPARGLTQDCTCEHWCSCESAAREGYAQGLEFAADRLELQAVSA